MPNKIGLHYIILFLWYVFQVLISMEAINHNHMHNATMNTVFLMIKFLMRNPKSRR